MKKEEIEKIWDHLEGQSFDTLYNLKQEAARRIKWARHAFTPKHSMNLVGGDPRFKRIFSKTRGYSTYKFKEVEKGEFGKNNHKFKEFIDGIAEYYNVPFHIFMDETIKEVWFQKMIRDGWTIVKDMQEDPPKRSDAASQSDTGDFLPEDWGTAPDVRGFFGREEELAQLTEWIEGNRCRVVTVTGMGGIGKTRLAVRFARLLMDMRQNAAKQDQKKDETPAKFDGLIWRSLIHAPSAHEILEDWLQYFSGGDAADLPDDFYARHQLLMEYLRSRCFLMILDNAETVLQSGTRAGSCIDGYGHYADLFRQIGETPHQSVLLITSRERPREIDRMAGANKPVRILELSGLNSDAGAAVLQDGGLSLQKSACEKMTAIYKGNPLALELACHHIQDVFFGDADEFLKTGLPVFDDISDLLDQHFKRFSDREKEVLYWLAINSEPVSLKTLKTDILSPASKEALASTVQSLQRRIPLEKTARCYTLQPVLMEFITRQFIQAVRGEIAETEIRLLDTHALVKAASDDHIRNSQIRVIVQPLLEEVVRNGGSIPALNNRHNRLLDRLLDQVRASEGLKNGYAAGSILNLLILAGADLTGYDFSGMTIRQAVLQGICLHDATFSNAKFHDTTFTRHLGSVLDMALSPDKNHLAMADTHCHVRIWRIADARPAVSIAGLGNWIRGIAFHPTLPLLAGCGEDTTVRLWDTASGSTRLVLKGHDARVQTLAFSPDGRYLATAGYDQTVRIWDIANGTCLKVFTGHKASVHAVCFSPDGAILASGGKDCRIRIWDTAGGECRPPLEGHGERILTMAFTHDGKLLASAGDDRDIRLWRIASGKCVRILKGHKARIRALAVSPDDEILASSGDGQKIRLWHLAKGVCDKVLKGHAHRTRSLVFGSQHILFSGGDDQTVRRWDTASGTCLNTFSGHMNFIRSIRFSGRGQTLASCGQDHAVRVWQAEIGRITETRMIADHWPLTVFCPDRQWIALTTGKDMTLKMIDIATGQCLMTFTGHENWVRDAVLIDDGRWVLSGSDDQTARMWDAASGKCLHIFKGHENRVCTVAAAENGAIAATGGYDHAVRVWNIRTGRCKAVLTGHRGRVCAVAFSKDGHLLASAGADHTVRLWDCRTHQCINTLTGHENWVRTVAFSPDGAFIASGSEDHTIRVWQVSTGQCVQILKGHENWIMCVAFHPAGGLLASGSVDETIRIWDARTGICRTLLRPPRPYERMNIEGAQGLSAAQESSLHALGAVGNASFSHIII